MRGSLTFAALGLWAVAPTIGAAADRLVLQAEDTPGMTRIEIVVNDIPFSLEKPEAGVIDFVTPYRFDSVNMAQLIAGGAARRVANARLVPDEAATRLRMVLNCDCGFDFSVSSGVLSVRIKDPAKADAPVEGPEATEPPTETASATPQKPAPDTAPSPRARPKVGTGANLASLAPAPESEVAAGDQNAPATPSTFVATDEKTAEEVILARDHLLRQLSRAAEQGLVQFVSDEAAAQSPAPETPPAKTAETEQEDIAPVETPPAVEAAAPAPAPAIQAPAAPPAAPVEIPLRARTAVDKDFTPDRSETRVAVAYCIQQARLDVPSWSLPGSFLETSLDLRANLLDEFDQPRPETATKLARHLVLNGFGAEAEEMLRVYGDVIEDREVLGDLARLVDLKAPDPEGDIARSAPCHPEAALWRAIAGLPDGEQTDISTDSQDDKEIRDRQMLDAFARLPAATRRILGAGLMNNLIKKGELDLANQLDLILRRSPSTDDDALSLARARLLSETGRLEEAEELYAELSQSNRPEAHKALILLLDSRISRNAGGSSELSNALGDAAFSARGTPSELPLKVAEIRSRTLTDGASGALETLQRTIERSGGASELLQDVGHATLEALTPVGGDVVDYTRAVMALRPYVSESASGDPARRRVADVLTEAGLPNLAYAYLQPALNRQSRATSVAAARTLLALDEAEEALAALEGQAGPAATPLRMEALERLGRHEEAHLLSVELAQDDSAAHSARALRAGEWADASAAGATSHRLLAAFMASKKTLDDEENAAGVEADFLSPPEVDRETTLESIRSVVEASRSARSIIEKALEDG